MFPKWMTLFFLLFLLRFVTIVIGLVLAGTSARLHIISTCLTEMIFFSHGFLFSRSRTRDECSEGTVSCPAWKDTLDKGQPPPSMIGYYRARYNLIQLQLLLLLAVMNQKRARIFFRGPNQTNRAGKWRAIALHSTGVNLEATPRHSSYTTGIINSFGFEDG